MVYFSYKLYFYCTGKNRRFYYCFCSRSADLITFKLCYFTFFIYAELPIKECKYNATVFALADYKNPVFFDAIYRWLSKTESVMFTLFFVIFTKQPDTYRKMPVWECHLVVLVHLSFSTSSQFSPDCKRVVIH